MKISLHNLQENCPAGHSDYLSLTRAREACARRCGAVVLCMASISLAAVFFVFNFLEGAYNLLPALVAASVLPLLTLLRLSRNLKAPALLFLCGLNFIALSAYLFIYDNSTSNQALFWFLFVPPLVVFSMSRRMAFCLFLVFLLALGALLFTLPGHASGDHLSLGFRVRFMAFAVLTFCLFWFVEYIRSRTDRTLIRALYRMRLCASTDPLTGIGNYRDFHNHLKWLQAQSERSGEPFSMALLDIDHFARINKAHGHHLGDELLRHVAMVINDALRETDRVFRWGGGKFAVIMPGVDLRDAGSVIERVRRHVEIVPLPLNDGSVIKATVSVGVEAWSRVSTLDEVLSNADSRLYLAKKLGKNRVYAGAVDQAVEWFPGLRALPRLSKSPAHALANFPVPAALPARV